MKKSILLTVLLFAVICSQQAYGKIWRINNLSNYNGTTLFGDNLGGSADYPVFKEIGDAMISQLVSATAGDTLYVEGTSVSYKSVTINKRVIMIGAGYFLNENPSVSAHGFSTWMNSPNEITFEEGSEGSELIGFRLDDVTHVNTDSITLKRCILTELRISKYEETLTGISVLQNYFQEVENNNFTRTIILLGGATIVPDLIFNNNIVRQPLYSTSDLLIRECKNNVFDIPNLGRDYDIEITVGSFENNILMNAAAAVRINGGTNSGVRNNISAAANNQFGQVAGTGNVVVTNIASLFVDPAGQSTDGAYQLRPEAGTSYPGSDGAPRGAFGGAVVQNRYSLSGLAAIPVIYEANTTGVAGPYGLEVQIKARTIQ